MAAEETKMVARQTTDLLKKTARETVEAVPKTEETVKEGAHRMKSITRKKGKSDWNSYRGIRDGEEQGYS
jgi:hypothetical protein